MHVFGTNVESSTTATESITSRQTLARVHDAAFDQLSQKLTATEIKFADTQTVLAATQDRMGQLENMANEAPPPQAQQYADFQAPWEK
ncbi:hypothetical protein LINPERPRIM_LOCUS31250 [Linum perenne]